MLKMLRHKTERILTHKTIRKNLALQTAESKLVPGFKVLSRGRAYSTKISLTNKKGLKEKKCLVSFTPTDP